MDPSWVIFFTSFRRTIAAVAKAELWAKAQWLLDESKSRGSRPDASTASAALGSLWGRCATVEETVFLGSARHYMGMFLLGIFDGIYIKWWFNGI